MLFSYRKSNLSHERNRSGSVCIRGEFPNPVRVIYLVCIYKTARRSHFDWTSCPIKELAAGQFFYQINSSNMLIRQARSGSFLPNVKNSARFFEHDTERHSQAHALSAAFVPLAVNFYHFSNFWI